MGTAGNLPEELRDLEESVLVKDQEVHAQTGWKRVPEGQSSLQLYTVKALWQLVQVEASPRQRSVDQP